MTIPSPGSIRGITFHHPLAFWLGCLLLAAGVYAHAPMFLMGRHNHFMLVGMPIGWDMVLGMVAIVAGCGIAAYGLLPRDIEGQLREKLLPKRNDLSRGEAAG